MPLYRFRDKLIFFVHIPKTGGSTVEELLVSYGAKQALKFHKRLGYSNSTPQHMHAAVYRKLIPKSFYDYALALVRNPYARLASEYKWRSKLSGGQLPSFDQWILESLASLEESPYLYDNHMRRQSEFVSPSVEIFRLEDGIEKPIKAAIDALGIEPPAVEIHHAKKSTPEPLVLKGPAREAVVAYYAADFEAFGYSPDDLPDMLRPG
jgi:hypothetical protein